VAKLGEKIQASMDEARILILGTQVLLGFEYRSFFEARFPALPDGARLVKLVAISTMLVAFALMVLPGAYHRIAAEGHDRPDVQRFTTRVLGIALLPLAVGLGLDVAVSVRIVAGTVAAAAAGSAATGLALLAWYGFTAAERERHPRGPEVETMRQEETKLPDRIKHVLTEARMVLPGAQALLGFQLAIVISASFETLPNGVKSIHGAALLLVALSIVLLMAPAAYHRMV
jgi:hypothetical protein